LGTFHPIHEIPERDFLDGALLGAGSLKPELIKYLCWLDQEIHQFFEVLGNKHDSLIPNIFKNPEQDVLGFVIFLKTNTLSFFDF
jgi:hypothetical protein